MTGFLIALGIVAWCAALFALAHYAIDNGSLAAGIAAAVVIVLGLGFALNKVMEADRQGPCLREETRVMWTGKTAVPYTYCVERGRWVE